MTTWIRVQRSLPPIPVLPCLATPCFVQVQACAARAAVGSRTRLQLVALMMASFCVLMAATVIAGHEIAAYGLDG